MKQNAVNTDGWGRIIGVITQISPVIGAIIALYVMEEFFPSSSSIPFFIFIPLAAVALPAFLWALSNHTARTNTGAALNFSISVFLYLWSAVIFFGLITFLLLSGLEFGIFSNGLVNIVVGQGGMTVLPLFVTGVGTWWITLCLINTILVIFGKEARYFLTVPFVKG